LKENSKKLEMLKQPSKQPSPPARPPSEIIKEKLIPSEPQSMMLMLRLKDFKTTLITLEDKPTPLRLILKEPELTQMLPRL